jgi:RNA polymerase sigma-70 factor (ECF subfamily)
MEDARRETVVRELVRHRSNLFAFILSIVRDFEFAEEVMQEVAVVVCDQWADFKAGTNFGAWAAQIARNKIFNLNRAARKQILLTKEAIEAIESASDEATPSGWIEAVKTCLDAVGGKAKSILTMRYRDGLSGAQIARRTKSTVVAVHMALSRARAAVAQCVEGRLIAE